MNVSLDNQILARVDPNSHWLKPTYPIKNPPLEQVEIQLVSWCNRSCAFCPSGNFAVPTEMMEWEVIQHIIHRLEQVNFCGTVGLHLICEPLLHKSFSDVVAEFRQRLPKTFIRIESNGDVLDNRMTKLIDYFDAGLNEILINCYDSVKQRDARNQKILDLVGKDRTIYYWNRKMRNPMGRRCKWRVVKLRDFFEEDYSLRNWAGHVSQQRREHVTFPIPLSCDRPFKRLHLNYKGQAILCNNDWKFDVIIGDLTADSLTTVWNSPILVDHYRPALLECDRSKTLCKSCDSGVPWTKSPRLSPAHSTPSFYRSLWSRIVQKTISVGHN